MLTAFPYSAVLDVSPSSLLGNNTETATEAKALTTTQVRALLSLYTISQVDTLLAAKAASAHTHPVSDITGLSTTLATKADLVNGLVPAGQLPSYVDDVLEYASLAVFPATGDSGKIYVALDTGRTYRWGGSTYAELTDSSAVWGSISGTLANQSDIVSALAGKSNVGHTHTYSSLTGIPSTFAPSTHAASHALGGADALAPSDIGAVPTSRQLTINGTAFDLSTDRSWTVSGGISTLNTLTDATQTFATGTTGTDFAVSSAAGVHTFNLPDASATARGVVTTGAQTFTGAKTFNNSITFGGNSLGILFNGGNTGLVQTASNVLNFQISNNTRATINGSFNTDFGFGTGFTWYSGGTSWGFVSDAAYAIAIRSGTNAQTLRIYNTYTSSTSLERLNISWVSNICTIGTEAGSAGGSVRTLQLLGCPSTAAGYGTAGSLLISGGVYSGADTAGVNAGDVTISTADTVSRGLSLPGTITLKGGDATGNRSSTTNTNAGHIFITAGTAVGSTETTNASRGANGGRIDITTGAGGNNSVTAGFARSGGRFYVVCGAGGVASGASSTGGLGGAVAFLSGGGGYGAAVGGNGGSVTFNAGSGGNGTATGSVGGSGGPVHLAGGGGGAGGLNGQHGDGGDVYLTGGFSPSAMNGALQGNHGRVVFSLAGNQKVLWRWNYVQFLDTTNTVPPAGYDFEFGTTYGTKLGTAANQKLAFFGSTPIVQRTPSSPSAAVVSPGAGNVIKTDDTFGGYTIAQAIQAMIDFGFLFKP